MTADIVPIRSTMLYFHNCQQFDTEFQQEDNATIRIVERKLEHLKARRKFVPNKTLKVYDRAGLYVQRFMGQRMNMRVLIEEYKFEHREKEHVIYFLREYIPQSKYEPRWRNYILPEIEEGTYKKRHPLPEEEIERAKAAYIRQLENGLGKAMPPFELTNWFQEDGFGIEPEFRIYETQNWVTFSAEYGGQYLGDFFLILDAVYHQTGHHGLRHEAVAEVKGHRNLVISQYQEVYLIHEAFLHEKSGQVEQFMLVHDGGILGQEFSEEQRQRKIKDAIDFLPLRDITKENYQENDFAKGAVRAYPANLLRDRTSWRAVQMYNNKSNLALSPEQLELLKDYQFPKFINGQAGSGKSEMLYYLIAEVIFRQQVYGFEDKIIFLTENEELLKKAMQDTRSKLAYNSQYRDVDLQKVDLQQYFSPFRRFLLDNFVDAPEEFPEGQFVNFARFRKLYQESNLHESIKKQYSAEIAWYVIYTFIKGQKAEQEALNAERFEHLFKKDKGRLDKRTFEDVYEKIWKPFYSKLRKKGYWDQLDLVRDVLNRYQSIPPSEKLTVILCDEAQDFTRIELQLIIRLSRFSDFDLSGLPQVPISFAGDPFQTVNPTGFSLEKLKRLFGKELEEELNFELSHDALISELNYNYRSSSPIVDLANVVQYFRRRFLNTPDLNRPQEAKRLGKSPRPQLFALNESAPDLFARLGKGVVYLVSCNDGEEEQLIEEDAMLEEEFIVKSSARAKGSEYPAVAIYKFGQHFLNTYSDQMLNALLTGRKKYDELSSSEQFEISFFFNKLYVAITRAQEDCYIIDTTEGVTAFWEPLRQISQLPDIEDAWAGAIHAGFMEEGNIEMVNNTDLESLLKIAHEEKENGLAFEDPDRLRDAAKAFAQVPDIQYKKEEDYCMAKALEFERKFEEAGDILIQYSRSFSYEANRAYLMGEAWEKILAQEEGGSEKVNTLRFIAKIMNGSGVSIDEALRYITKAQEVFNDRSCRGRLPWKEDFFRMLADLSGSWVETADAETVQQLADRMSAVKWTSDAYYNSIAHLYAFAGNHADAVEYWELCENYSHEAYYRAKLQTPIDAGEKLFYLFQLGESEAIIRAYEKNKEHRWQENDLQVVVNAYIRGNQYGEAIHLAADDGGLWTYLEDKMLRKQTNVKTPKLFLDAVLEVADAHPILRNTILAPEFIAKVADFILSPFFKEERELNDPKRISGRMKGAEGVIYLAGQFIRLLARSKAIPKDFAAFPTVYALVRIVTNKKGIPLQRSVSSIEQACAIERTHDKYLDAIKAIRKLPTGTSDGRIFIQQRIQKLQFKKVMIDIGAQGNTRLQNLEGTQESNFHKLYRLEPKDEMGKGMALLPLSEVDKAPLFPDLYAIPGMVEVQQAKLTMHQSAAQLPQPELTPPMPEEPVGPVPMDEPKAMPPKIEQSPVKVEAPDESEELPAPQRLLEEEEVLNEESTQAVMEAHPPEQAEEVKTTISSADPSFQQQIQALLNAQKNLQQQSENMQKAIDELRQSLTEMEDLKISNSKLQTENAELYRELAEVQRKYIGLRDKEE